ncbi:hypothetical protein JTE90_024129 [Oedothorax gibbosus]|uniref:Uncharacterized protein n=1 Tax=Oedothorax gibbosus TaxID=931172 RepID=A0AAV6TNT1_9ARAC|nr:hypothetical protein JTE90_024129 [Oedothorax gibbosus]
MNCIGFQQSLQAHNTFSALSFSKATFGSSMTTSTSMTSVIHRRHLVSIFLTWRRLMIERGVRNSERPYHLGFRGNLPVFIQNFLNTRVFQVRVGSTLSRDFYQREGVLKAASSAWCSLY